MSDWAQKRAMSGAAGSPLSGEQKRDLVLLSRRAYDALAKKGQLPSGQSFDDFRHQHCLMATERSGLRDAVNEDFLPLRAHFLMLLGAEAAAGRTQWAAANEPSIWARRTLAKEIGAARATIENPEAYVTAICRCKFKIRPIDCSAKQIWTLVFDIRRAVQKRKKNAAPPVAPPQQDDDDEEAVPF